MSLMASVAPLPVVMVSCEPLREPMPWVALSSMTTVSIPEPPVMVLLPVPPFSVSLFEPPWSESSPSPPLRLSSPLPPWS